MVENLVGMATLQDMGSRCRIAIREDHFDPCACFYQDKTRAQILFPQAASITLPNPYVQNLEKASVTTPIHLLLITLTVSLHSVAKR